MAIVTIKVRDCRRGQVEITYRSEKGLSRDAGSKAEQVAAAMMVTANELFAKSGQALDAAAIARIHESLAKERLQ